MLAVDTPGGAGDHKVVAGANGSDVNGAPHAFEDSADGVTGLGGALWPVLDTHGSAGDGGCGEEGSGVG